jgi:hypothetical protein
MGTLLELLNADGFSYLLDPREPAVAELAAVARAEVFASSIVTERGIAYFLARTAAGMRLGLLYFDESEYGLRAFAGCVSTRRLGPREAFLKWCDCTPENAAVVRQYLPPVRLLPLGPGPSLGMGDRLGLATPAHVRAVRDSGVQPVFAQQSVREMSRTGRSPAEVMADATWGVLREGGCLPVGFGADADHLKTTADIAACLNAGFTMFTVDPGAFVDDEAGTASGSALDAKFAALPWEELESSPADCRNAYLHRRVKLAQGRSATLTEEGLRRAAAKYGAAVAHAATLHRHLRSDPRGEWCDFEVSVDETATPTTAIEHHYVASELRRLGVRWTSLAPRFVGDFEKGVDYKGDLAAFERCLADHVAIARALGPYKISIHSGSDKFAIYAIAARVTDGQVHVKTAGTSYVEALRAVATVAPDLFREVLDFARERYDTDRATYHVSAEMARVPRGADVPVADLPGLLDQPDVRQALHVTYGSVLNAQNADGSPRFRPRLFDVLRLHEDVHLGLVERHLRRHVEPLRKG